MAPYKKKTFYRKAAKKVVRTAAKVYRNPHIRGTPQSTIRLARDVAYLKSQINAEHKHIDTTFGTEGTYTAQQPTAQTPIVIPLELPVKGTGNYERIGNQIVITNITMKLGMDFQNTTDRHVRTECKARIVFAKDASSVPDHQNLLMPDPNGNFTPLSYTNEQEYKKYIWIKSLTTKRSYVEKIATSQIANTGTPTSPTQRAKFYPRASWRGRIKNEYETGTNNCTVNKPYLLITSNVEEDTPYNWDPVYLSGTIRISYIDN